MDSAMLTAVRLAKEGFGTPEQILEMRTDIVLAALDYSEFTAAYESKFQELNREK